MGLVEPDGDEQDDASGNGDLEIWSETRSKAVVDGGEVEH